MPYGCLRIRCSVHMRRRRSPHYRNFAELSHHVNVPLVWWCLAGALFVLSAALFRRQIEILSVANPTSRLPWVGWPASTPRGARAFGLFGTFTAVIAMNCVIEALNRRHLYDVLWALPFCVMVGIVTTVPQVQHNRRVRRGIYVGPRT
jgi:hypothetical protein